MSWKHDTEAFRIQIYEADKRMVWRVMKDIDCGEYYIKSDSDPDGRPEPHLYEHSLERARVRAASLMTEHIHQVGDRGFTKLRCFKCDRISDIYGNYNLIGAFCDSCRAEN